MIRPRRLIALSLLLSAVSGVIAVAAVLVAVGVFDNFSLLAPRPFPVFSTIG
jgi:hypothetical protein